MLKLLVYEIRQNSSISGKTRRPNIRLAPLLCQVSVLSNDIQILVFGECFGVLTPKKDKINCPIIERVTRLYIQ